MIEGSGSGSIPLTYRSGSGSRRPKNMWIRWIRIRNTAYDNGCFSKEMLNTESIKQFPSKERMAHISEAWKKVRSFLNTKTTFENSVKRSCAGILDISVFFEVGTLQNSGFVTF
jgi:hypothetical protein